MNLRLPRLLVCLVFGLMLGASVAQEEDVVLERYTLAVDSLNRSVEALPSDGALSLELLDRAAVTLGPLAQGSTSTTLVGSMEHTFERARTAVRNQSQIDLAVQSSVLAGAFQRLVYEAALREASVGNVALAQSRLTRIAADMPLSQEAQAALAEPLASEGALRATFEHGVAEAVRERVARVRQQEGELEIDGNYRVLAQAYSMFIPVQDSPRLSEDASTTFVAAIDALVTQGGEGLGDALDRLDAQMAQLSQAAGAVLGRAPSAVEPVPAAPTPEIAPADAALPETAAASEATTAVLQPLPAVPAQPSALEHELAAYGLPAASAERLIANYQQSGFSSVAEALDSFYVTGARIVTAAESGNQPRAQQLITDFRSRYSRLLEPLVESRDGGFNSRTLELLRGFERTPALRLQDAVVLVGHLEAIDGLLANQAPSWFQEAMVTANIYWSGFVRLALMVLLGILAFVPLYLLNLAFGGGNRNWRWVGLALFLLLLPMIYEGLSFLGSLVAELSGISAFGALAGFSIFQNTLAQMVWVMMTALAILFAILGLYGICVQFGLLGKRAPDPRATATSETRSRVTAGDTGPDTVVDWDEEF